MAHLQMRYREGAKDAKLREVEIKSCFLLRATSRASRLRGKMFWLRTELALCAFAPSR
jgi:hypothetical protein